MENASKALMIAGAILIAVLLISLSIAVLDSTRKAQDAANKEVESVEIQSFNEQFMKYQGTIVTASQVKSLLLLIRANNSYYDFDSSTKEGTDKYVKVTGDVTSSSLFAHKTYRVTIDKFNENGFVSIIRVELNS